MNGAVPSADRSCGCGTCQPMHEVACEHCNGSGVVIVDMPGCGPGGLDCLLCGGCGLQFVEAHPVGEAHA